MTGEANFVLRQISRSMFSQEFHITFEFRNKEYNYGHVGGELILKIPLEKMKNNI